MKEPLKPPYGERVVSWRAVQEDLVPDLFQEPEFAELAAELHRLRGLVMAQGAETEAVLGQIVLELDPDTELTRQTAGQLLRLLRRLLPSAVRSHWDAALTDIDRAIKCRNRVVHADVTIGSTWVPYATGGGEFVPVISLMKGDDYDETDLRRDLVLQQEATIAAVRMLLALQHHPATP